MNWGQSPESCIQCRPEQQLCDEDHQRVPKPATAGVWIDPETGESALCEPYAACIKHTTVEDTLSGDCAEGYIVRFACATRISLSNMPSRALIMAACSSVFFPL